MSQYVNKYLATYEDSYNEQTLPNAWINNQELVIIPDTERDYISLDFHGVVSPKFIQLTRKQYLEILLEGYNKNRILNQFKNKKGLWTKVKFINKEDMLKNLKRI